MEKERMSAVVITATKFWDNNQDYDCHMESTETYVIGVYSDYKMAQEKIKKYMEAIKCYLDAKLISVKAREAITSYMPDDNSNDYYVGEVEYDDKRDWWLEWDFGEFNRLDMSYGSFGLDEENKFCLNELFNGAL